MRDAKGRFCKATTGKCSKKGCCKKEKVTNKSSCTMTKEEFKKVSRGLEELFDSIENSMNSDTELPKTPEEAITVLDKTIREMQALKTACEVLVALQDAHIPSEGCCKKKTKKPCKKAVENQLMKETMELAEELGIPPEDIVSCGMLNLDTGEKIVKKFR